MNPDYHEWLRVFASSLTVGEAWKWIPEQMIRVTIVMIFVL